MKNNKYSIKSFKALVEAQLAALTEQPKPSKKPRKSIKVYFKEGTPDEVIQYTIKFLSSLSDIDYVTELDIYKELYLSFINCKL
jgi:ferredoxin-fold anticodon binding domain-containing protein